MTTDSKDSGRLQEQEKAAPELPRRRIPSSPSYLEGSLGRLPIPYLLLVAATLRAVLIVYGEFHDSRHALKYTDVDYSVFSDAAAYILGSRHAGGRKYESSGAVDATGPLATHLADLTGWHAGSPYERATYRYTPLLALLLVPNAHLHRSLGKILFASADLIVGYLIYASLRDHYKLPPNKARVSTSLCWLLNPFVANISTRGNAESILGVLVVATLYLASAERWLPAALLYGISVHFKIYPVVYAATFLAHLSSVQGGRLFTVLHVKFALVSLLSFSALSLAMYAIWGQEYLEHAWLYHLTRLDHRHNFAPHFYDIYLSLYTLGAHEESTQTVLDACIAFLGSSFVPQLGLTAFAGAVLGYYTDLAFAAFVQTFVFVLFNRVCTSQYYMWYLWLLPLALPSMRLSRRDGVSLLLFWVAAQVPWLYSAYSLEFLGVPVFLNLWITGLVWFGINVEIVRTIVASYSSFVMLCWA